jgi:hypothetical protein
VVGCAPLHVGPSPAGVQHPPPRAGRAPRPRRGDDTACPPRPSARPSTS